MFKQGKKAVIGIVALGALALGGAAIADAATSQGSSSTTTSPSASQPPAFRGPAHGTAAHEDAEKPVTGAAAAKAQAAAVKALGGGTAGAVTTDYTQHGYEVTVTKSNGTKVEVHLDSSFNVMQGPRGHGGPQGAGPGQPPAPYGG
jgi:hypothetical protein